MCGIYGYVGPDAALATPDALEKAIAALWHRGPDDRGTFHALSAGRGPSASGALVVGLAHTRLSIIDLSAAGHQPMTTEDGRYTIVYNGEIYNHAAIRGELSSLGCRFHSSSDTEVLLQAYARWGKGCLARLRGMFAFAVWDAVEQRLFLARDRLGIKPLYYVARGRGLAFASEIRALLAVGAAERKLSPAAVGSYFAFGAVSGPSTILDGVHGLPPGHTLELDAAGKVTIERYWQLPLEPSPRATFADEVRQIQPILQESVRLRLIADVPVGIFLSGGIDSSVLAALASQPGGAPVHTFTVTFDEARFSEAPFAAEVARLYRCHHQQVHLSASRAASEIGEAVAALDQPSSDGVNTYFVSKAAREAGLSVALSGLGGDELFAGYGFFRQFGRSLDLLRKTRSISGLLRAGLGRFSSSPSAPTTLRKLSALLLSSGRADQVYAVFRAMFTDEERGKLLDPDFLAQAGSVPVNVPDHLIDLVERGTIDPINALSALELGNYIRNTLLRDCDVMSMAHALEVRVPLLDHVLVEKVLRVPGPLKLSASGNKPLLTAAVPGLPRSAIDRSKMGFTLPFDDWFRGPLRPWIEGMLLDGAVRRLGFFRPDAVERAWKAFLHGERYMSHTRIWAIAALAGWCQNHRVG
ncbi:MAG: asparagine synthase (glutamine-hydrolyzing) [Byssovorax sp.]